jgi:DNA mismatch repair protein MutL
MLPTLGLYHEQRGGWYNPRMPIQILSQQVANQIAAGEVVERPASVVKELIENSLDAGATDIRVEVREGGRRLIRVQDNGCGIPIAEARLAFERHATSKIVSLDDLDRLKTLGFRGEALASIAAVAHVTLSTRAVGEEVGVLIRIREGREIAHEARGAPPGTVVTVEHLFANLPARLKFLKQPATEAGHIQQTVTRYALAFPERRFNLVSDGRLILQTSGSGKPYDVLVKVYGLEMARQMLPVGSSEGAKAQVGEPAMHHPSSAIDQAPAPIVVSGYASTPALHRSNRSYITLFVNRRWFQDTTIAYSVIQAYHTLLPAGRYPVALIFIEIDPADVDVNVHPTKAEVRFGHDRAVFSAVQRAVRETLLQHAPVPEVDLTPSAAPQPVTQWSLAGAEGWAMRRDALLAAGRGPQHLGPGDQPASSQIPDSGLSQTPDWGQLPASSFQYPASRPQLPLLRVVGQVNAAYIVAEGPDGMYLIDQHAAHERVLYEQVMVQRVQEQLPVQPLLEPLVLDLSPEQAAVVGEEIQLLNELGVAIEPFGGATYLLRSIPAILGGDEPQSALVEIVDGLMQNTDTAQASREAALITGICKRAAVKAGQPMSIPEMQELVRRLEGCRSPRTCPHGRPTMIYLSAADLARQFGRK